MQTEKSAKYWHQRYLNSPSKLACCAICPGFTFLWLLFYTDCFYLFWSTVCKTVRPLPSDRCPVRLSVCLSVLFILSVCDVGALWPTIGRFMMKHGTQVGLGSGHIVLDGDSAPPPPTGHSPQFSAQICCQMTAWINMPLDVEVALSPGDFMLNGDPSSPPWKGAEPPIFGPRLLWPNGCMGQNATWYGRRP